MAVHSLPAFGVAPLRVTHSMYAPTIIARKPRPIMMRNVQ